MSYENVDTDRLTLGVRDLWRCALKWEREAGPPEVKQGEEKDKVLKPQVAFLVISPYSTDITCFGPENVPMNGNKSLSKRGVVWEWGVISANIKM